MYDKFLLRYIRYCDLICAHLFDRAQATLRRNRGWKTVVGIVMVLLSGCLFVVYNSFEHWTAPQTILELSAAAIGVCFIIADHFGFGEKDAMLRGARAFSELRERLQFDIDRYAALSWEEKNRFHQSTEAREVMGNRTREYNNLATHYWKYLSKQGRDAFNRASDSAI